MSELTQAMLINAVVLIAVLHGDLGRARKIGPVRILRPLLTAGAVIPLFIDAPVGHGTGLTIELAGVAAGILGGLAALALMRVYRKPETGKPVSRATAPYALLWIVVIGARAAFSYGSEHWFSRQLTDWCITHQVTAAGITDGLIFMAIAMVLVRTGGLALRAGRLPDAARVAAAPRNAVDAGGQR